MGAEIDPRRAAALDMAFMASRLLDEKYFDDCSKAVQTNDKNLFMQVCTQAQIPPDAAENIWSLVSKEVTKMPGGW